MFLFWGVLNKGFQPVLKATAIGYVVNMYSTLLGMRVRFIPFTSPPLSTLPITMVPMSCVVGHDSCIHCVQRTRCTTHKVYNRHNVHIHVHVHVCNNSSKARQMEALEAVKKRLSSLNGIQTCDLQLTW